jgi:hypothetical protein
VQVKVLQAINAELKGGGKRAPDSASGDSSVWLLQEVEFSGRMYLLDPATQFVYDAPAATAGGFVRPVGVRSAAGLLPSTGTVDFFQALDAYLKQHQVRLRDVFTQFDTKGDPPLLA